MVKIRPALAEDLDYWFSLDKHLKRQMILNKLNLNECYIIENLNKKVGIMRYNFFWDETPFLNLIFISQENQRKGIGTQALSLWEQNMKESGYDFVMTSTMSNENAQHFYRKLGYKDCGCLVIKSEPMEILLCKQLTKLA